MISFKVAKSIKIIVHLRQFCLTEIPLNVFNSRILPCLQYTALLFGPLLTLFTYHQFYAARKSSSPFAHSYPLFKTLHILDIFKI